MPWGFVAVGTNIISSTTTFNLAEPAGVRAGDLIIACISYRNASTTSVTLPAGGWQLIDEQKTNNVTANNASGVASGCMAYIIRGDSAPSYAFTLPAAISVGMGQVVAYRGGVLLPLDTHASTTMGAAGTAISGTGLTTSGANELVVAITCGGRNITTTTHDAATDPGTDSGSNTDQTAAPIVGTWQERADTGTNIGADTGLSISDAIRGTAGATGSITATASASAQHVVIVASFIMETVSVDRWLVPLSPPSVMGKTLPTADALPALAWSTMTPPSVGPGGPVPATSVLQPSRGGFQYQARFEPVPQARETVSVDRWLVPLSMPIFRRPTMAAAPALFWSTFTPSVVVTVTVASWVSPFSDPIRAAPRAYLVPPPTGPPNTAPETTTLDRWLSPLSLPTPPKGGLAAARQQAHTEPVSLLAETTTVDRWHVPLSLPVRQQPRVHLAPPPAAPPFQPSTAPGADGPVPSTAVLQPSRGGFQYQAWTKPVLPLAGTPTVPTQVYPPFALPLPPRVLPKPLHPPYTAPILVPDTPVPGPDGPVPSAPVLQPSRLGFQYQARFEPVPQLREATTLDRWYQPLSLPTPPKRALSAAQQQARIEPLPQAKETVSIDRWLVPLSVPSVLARAGLTAAQQQAHTEPVSLSPETTTLDRWFAPLALPVWQKPALKAANQQAFFIPLLPQPAPALVQTYPPLALPTPPRAGLGAAQQQAHTEPVSVAQEITSLDRWYAPLALPPWRAPFPPAQQQAHTEPVSLAPETTTLDRWFVRFPDFARKPGLAVTLQSVHTEPLSEDPETLTLDKWFAPFSRPIFVRRVQQPPALTWSTFAAEAPTPSIMGWHVPLSLPLPPPIYRQRDEPFAPPDTAPERTTLDRWYAPLSLPVPRRPVQHPAALAWSTRTPPPPVVPTGTWFAPFGTPSAKRVLPVPLHPPYTAPISTLPETTTLDRWFVPLSLPPKPKAGLGAHLQANYPPPGMAAASGGASGPVAAAPVLQPSRLGFQYQAFARPPQLVAETTTVDRWHQPFSRPVIQRRVQQPPASVWNAFTPAPPVVVISSGWYQPFSRPVPPRVPQQPAALTWSGFTPAPPVVTPSVASWAHPFPSLIARPRFHPALLPAQIKPIVSPAAFNVTVRPNAGRIIFQGFAPLVQVFPTSSGTANFRLSNADVLIEAFGRLGIQPDALGREHMLAGRSSLNLELQAWSNYGLNLWTLVSGTIALVPGQATYQLPANLVTMTDLYFTPTGGNDRALLPMTRTEYAGITNKMIPGAPTRYWYQMLDIPQVTLWEVPSLPDTIAWFGYAQVEDANLPTGETPEIHYRAFDALCAKVALRLCEKFGNAKLMQEKRDFADLAWAKLQRRDQEPGTLSMRPKLPGYGRMRTPR